MSRIILPSRRISQPQGVSDIDWSNPLALGLTDVFNPISTTNKTSLRKFTPYVSAGTITNGVGAVGRNITFPAGTVDCGLVISEDADYLIPSLTDATIFVVRRSQDTTARASTLFGYEASATDRVLCHAPWSDGNMYFDFGGDGTANRISVAYTKSTSVEYLVFVAGGGKGREIWRNKIKIAGNASKTGQRTVTASTFSLGATQISNRASDSDEIYLFGLANRAWSDNEIASWFSNPWQIFKSSKSLWFDSAVGGGAAALAGSATALATATGALTTGIPISGASASVSTATGALTTAIPLAGSAASVSLAGGVLSTQITLSGDAVAAAAASGALTTQIVLSGTALAQALATGDLNTSPQGLAGNAAASASGSATLTTAIPLAGAASAFSVAAGGLITGIPLAGVAASVASATGDLTISITLSADSMAQAAASGSLSTQIQLSGAALASALATAAFEFTGIVLKTIRLPSAITRRVSLVSAI